MSTQKAGVKYRKVQRKAGQWLSIWCAVFGMLHILWIQSFTVTVVPSVSGLDIPNVPTIIFSVVFGVILLLAAGLTANLSDGQPSVIVGRWSVLKRVLLLVLSLGALVRAVLGVPGIVSGDAAGMTIVAGMWFLVAGVAGLVLWVALVRRKRELQG